MTRHRMLRMTHRPEMTRLLHDLRRVAAADAATSLSLAASPLPMRQNDSATPHRRKLMRHRIRRSRIVFIRCRVVLARRGVPWGGACLVRRGDPFAVGLAAFYKSISSSMRPLTQDCRMVPRPPRSTRSRTEPMGPNGDRPSVARKMFVRLRLFRRLFVLHAVVQSKEGSAPELHRMVRAKPAAVITEDPDALLESSDISRPSSPRLAGYEKVETWVSESTTFRAQNQRAIRSGFRFHGHQRIAVGKRENHLHAGSAKAGYLAGRVAAHVESPSGGHGLPYPS